MRGFAVGDGVYALGREIMSCGESEDVSGCVEAGVEMSLLGIYALNGGFARGEVLVGGIAAKVEDLA